MKQITLVFVISLGIVLLVAEGATLMFGDVRDNPNYGKYTIPVGEKFNQEKEGWWSVAIDTTNDKKPDIKIFISPETQNEKMLRWDFEVNKNPVTVFFREKERGDCSYYELSWISLDDIQKN